MSEWTSSLFGCFEDIKTCIMTIIVPCYVHGKTAESVGDICLLHCVLTGIPLLNVYSWASVRGKVRSNRNIEGGCVSDVAAVVCCTCCAISQSAREVSALAMSRT
ncbi:cornifelin homolog B-like [Symsagittifera roscoffensis]|uniref:cornifelin homolog B-like n=1 Tax=Symsagittifera roscoffensis TaxID=84072 RepID=UPI00307BE0AE